MFDLEWQVAAVPGLTAYGHVHTGSIAAVLEPGGSQVRALLAAARELGATVSYDPNARPSLMGRPEQARHVVESSIALADVVKLSDEDVEWLCPGEALDDVHARVGRARTGRRRRDARRRRRRRARHPHRRAAGTARAAASTSSTPSAPATPSWPVSSRGCSTPGCSVAPRHGRDCTTPRLADVVPAVQRALRTGALTVERAGAYAPTRAVLT